jgi:glycerophosphoryl diester phosphodiesterase
MLKIAHRGAKGYAPENTLIAFEKAIAMHSDGVELDVQLSKDHIPVVIHDETVDRTTTATGFVHDFTASQLHDIGIPSLKHVFDLVDRRCFINVEIKNIAAAQSVVHLIENYVEQHHWKYSNFLVSSFNWNELAEITTANTNIPIGVITLNDIDAAFLFAKKINAFSIHPFFELLDNQTVASIQKHGFKIFPWTVNSKETISMLHSFGVDGIISDFPDRI